MRGADDPVEPGRGPLEDEPPIAAIDQAERRPRPAVVREGLLRQTVEIGQGQEIDELAVRPGSAGVDDRPRAGHGGASASSSM